MGVAFGFGGLLDGLRLGFCSVDLVCGFPGDFAFLWG